jgi:hypothetical protein
VNHTEGKEGPLIVKHYTMKKNTLDSISLAAAGWTTEDSGFYSQQRQEIFFSP